MDKINHVDEGYGTVKSFIKLVVDNSSLFELQEMKNNIREEHYDDYYTPSYKKYGGYNGWSDDAIDDAFEGDPMNTWNVD